MHTPSMFGTESLQNIGDLARKADTTVPYVSMALNAVPLIAPEYGETTVKLDDSVWTTSIG